ncbi:MAG: hypothetical protein J1E84_02250 [Muribaculaceae bacterium]|nr:hypothetical protein [Muribaculaceae bacterium]
MSKLFLFAIGGTGSRVMRSLSILMASGVKLDVDEIVPVFIDPDASNADLTRTITLLQNYVTVSSRQSFPAGNNSRFFRTRIVEALPSFTLRVRDTDDRTFGRFINYASMSRADKAMTRMLFSDKNLSASMEVGFKGNPNIGSVVLNQIATSPDFATLMSRFETGDRIFIISSIFGGTGASGFPLLLKTLRSTQGFPNFGLVNTAAIGALTVLPYFTVFRDDNSEIDSATFISKTRSALAYYENNISRSGDVNALYFLGDEMSKVYDNHEGGASQQNDAHLIEFLGATAIVDFINRVDGSMHVSKELGLKDLEGSVTFDSFYDDMRGELYNPLVQFSLLANAVLDNLNYFGSDTFDANSSKKGNFGGIYTSRFMSGLKEVARQYRRWLLEIRGNSRSLDLFNPEPGMRPFDLINGVAPRRVMSLSSDYALIATRLNGAVSKTVSREKESRWLEMWWRATERLVAEKL